MSDPPAPPQQIAIEVGTDGDVVPLVSIRRDPALDPIYTDVPDAAPRSISAPPNNPAAVRVDEPLRPRQSQVEELLRRPARTLRLDEALFVLAGLATRPNPPITFTRKVGGWFESRLPEAFLAAPAPPPTRRRSGPRPPPPPSVEFTYPDLRPLRLHQLATEEPGSGLPVVQIDARIADVYICYQGDRGWQIRPEVMDPRLAVFVYKLALMLRARFGITHILHAGIHASHLPHDRYRAIDLSGFSVVSGIFAENAFVSRDWGDQRIDATRAPALMPRSDGAWYHYSGDPTGPVTLQPTTGAQRGADRRPSNRWPVFINGDYIQIPKGTINVDSTLIERTLLAAVRTQSGLSPDDLHDFHGQFYRLPAPGQTGNAPAIFEAVYNLCVQETSVLEGYAYVDGGGRHPWASGLWDVQLPFRLSHERPYSPGRLAYVAPNLMGQVNEPATQDNHTELLVHPDARTLGPWGSQWHQDHYHVQVGEPWEDLRSRGPNEGRRLEEGARAYTRRTAPFRTRLPPEWFETAPPDAPPPPPPSRGRVRLFREHGTQRYLANTSLAEMVDRRVHDWMPPIPPPETPPTGQSH